MILPGLTAEDDVVFENPESIDVDFECSLTMQTPSDFDVQAFLKEVHEINTKNKNLKKRKREDDEVEEKIAELPDSKDVIRLTECQHRFLAVPFLYHIMSSSAGFKCPICRSGSEMPVDLTQSGATPPCPAWECLCMISRRARERTRAEEAIEEVNTIIQLQRLEVESVYEMSIAELVHDLNITIIFSMFQGNRTNRRPPIPSANVPVWLRPNLNRSFLADEHFNIDDTPILYESGHAQRALGMLLRACSSFCVTLFAQTSEGEHSFFRSPMLTVPAVESIGDAPVLINCMSDMPGGVVKMFWNVSGSTQILRSIEYQASCASIRHVRIQALQGFAL